MDSLTPPPVDTTEALTRRYGADAIPPAGPWNETIAVMLDHRSVRSYKPDPLPPGTLETLIAAAQSAATSSNMQWWSAVAITDPEKKKVLAEVAGGQKHIEQCPDFIAWVADMSRNQRISDAEKTAFETMPWLETFMVACIDAALAAHPYAWDVILHNSEGYATECTRGNLVLQTTQGCITPPLSHGLLPGVLREALLKRGAIHEGPIVMQRLLQPQPGDILWFINSVRGWRPIRLDQSL